jgi:tagatose 1,6-diphosphate aldolase GatY/KbaY
MSELLQQAAAEGYAVPAFPIWDAGTMVVILQTAEKLKAPVIMMSGPSELAVMGPADMGAVAQTVARRFNAPASLHLDHGDSLELVEACLASGFTSVMLDFSHRPLNENAEAMRRVVTMAHPLNADGGRRAWGYRPSGPGYRGEGWTCSSHRPGNGGVLR